MIKKITLFMLLLLSQFAKANNITVSNVSKASISSRSSIGALPEIFECIAGFNAWYRLHVADSAPKSTFRSSRLVRSRRPAQRIFLPSRVLLIEEGCRTSRHDHNEKLVDKNRDL